MRFPVRSVTLPRRGELLSSDDPPSGERWSLRRILTIAAAVLAIGAVGVAALVWWLLEANLDRRSIQALEEHASEPASPAPPTAAASPSRTATTPPSPQGSLTPSPSPTAILDGVTEFLIVGSDDRGDLTQQERIELSTGGDFGPPRTDVILIVQLRPDDERAAVVSVPRDLLVDVAGDPTKINELMAAGGPNLLAQQIEELTGLELDHYVEVSIPAFLTVVDAVGGAEVCLDEPLVDDKSGADLPAGCQKLDGASALSYVRSREGDRGDFARIERQQQFLASLAERVTSARTFLDVPRLLRVVNRVAGSVTTDADLGIRQLRRLATEFDDFAAGGLTEVTLPAYAVEGGLRTYEPGAASLFAAMRRGERIPPRGPTDARHEAVVVLDSGGVFPEAARIESTLYFSGFAPRVLEIAAVDPQRTVVHPGPTGTNVAAWIGDLLGAPVEPLPADVRLAGNVDAVVAVGSTEGG